MRILRLFLLGLDGASYPYVTGPGWISMFSGVNPGKHGIFDVTLVKEDEIAIPEMLGCETPFVWDYFTWAGKRALVLGVPFIHYAPKN